MTVRIVLPPEVLAMALYTAEQRPKNVVNHIPLFDPMGELVGAMAEHAWAWLYRLPQDSVTSHEAYGDGGIDFDMEEGSVDIKASGRYEDSWVVKRGPCRADWYVFAFVQQPDTVIFKAKASKEVVAGIGTDNRVGGNRLIRIEQLEDFDESDFNPL
jgi:hypothetical protein